MKGPFKELSSALDADKLRLWTKEAEKADSERGEALDVYNVQMDKGWNVFLSPSTSAYYSSTLNSSNIGRDETQSPRCQDVNFWNTRLRNLADRRYQY
jgi:hypothetical protein